MTFYRIQPNIYGGLGAGCFPPFSELATRPLEQVEYVFDDLPNDCVTYSVPVFICTSELKSQLEKMNATGITFDSVTVSISEDLQIRKPEISPASLPTFYWLKLHGDPGSSDLAVSPDRDLIVSARVLEVLKTLGIEDAAILEYPGGKLIQPAPWDR